MLVAVRTFAFGTFPLRSARRLLSSFAGRGRTFPLRSLLSSFAGRVRLLALAVRTFAFGTSSFSSPVSLFLCWPGFVPPLAPSASLSLPASFAGRGSSFWHLPSSFSSLLRSSFADRGSHLRWHLPLRLARRFLCFAGRSPFAFHLPSSFRSPLLGSHFAGTSLFIYLAAFSLTFAFGTFPAAFSSFAAPFSLPSAGHWAFAVFSLPVRIGLLAFSSLDFC